MQPRAKAIIYVLVCAALWAFIPVVSKLGQANLDHHQFLFWSSLVSFSAFAAATAVAKQTKTFLAYTARDWRTAITLGFLGTYLYYILLYFGYINTQGLKVLALQYSWPVFTVLLSVLILKKKLTARKALAIIFGFLGVALVLTKGDFTDFFFNNYAVDILILDAALVFGLFSVLSKKENLEPYTMITIYFLTATVASFISMLVFSDFTWPIKNAVLPILANGLFINGYSYIFWIKALKLADASFISPFVFLTPILSAIYLIIFFDEQLLPVYGLGLAAVVVSGLLNIKNAGEKHDKARQTDSPPL